MPTGNPTLGIGFTKAFFSLSRIWGEGAIQPGVNLSGTGYWTNGCISGSFNPVEPGASGIDRGYGTPQISGGVTFVGPTMVFSGPTQEEWNRNPDKPNHSNYLNLGGRSPY